MTEYVLRCTPKRLATETALAVCRHPRLHGRLSDYDQDTIEEICEDLLEILLERRELPEEP